MSPLKSCVELTSVTFKQNICTVRLWANRFGRGAEQCGDTVSFKIHFMSIITLVFVWICEQMQLHWCLTPFIALLFISAMETSDGHLLLPDRVSLPRQPLFPLPLLHSTRDRWPCWHSHAVRHTLTAPFVVLIVFLLSRHVWWQTCRLYLHAPLQLDLHCCILWLTSQETVCLNDALQSTNRDSFLQCLRLPSC